MQEYIKGGRVTVFNHTYTSGEHRWESNMTSTWWKNSTAPHSWQYTKGVYSCGQLHMIKTLTQQEESGYTVYRPMVSTTSATVLELCLLECILKPVESKQDWTRCCHVHMHYTKSHITFPTVFTSSICMDRYCPYFIIYSWRKHSAKSHAWNYPWRWKEGYKM